LSSEFLFISPNSLPAVGRAGRRTNTNALNEKLKRVQHNNKKCVIPNQVLNLALKQVQGLSNSIYRFRNLEFGSEDKSIAFVLITLNFVCGLITEIVDPIDNVISEQGC